MNKSLFRKPDFPFLLTYVLYNQELNCDWFSTEEDLDETHERLSKEYGDDFGVVDCVEIGLLRNI